MRGAPPCSASRAISAAQPAISPVSGAPSKGACGASPNPEGLPVFFDDPAMAAIWAESRRKGRGGRGGAKGMLTGGWREGLSLEAVFAMPVQVEGVRLKPVVGRHERLHVRPEQVPDIVVQMPGSQNGEIIGERQ